MGGRLLALAIAALAAAAGRATAAEPAKCTLTKAAELPVTMRGLSPLAPVTINGQQVLFLADSGAFFSTISPAAADRLKLKQRPAAPGAYIQGVGGAVSVRIGVAENMTLDGVPLKNIQFLIAEGVGGDGGPDGEQSVGLLGQNVLGFADVEYDLANGVIRLMLAKGCDKVILAYWRKPGQAVSVVDVEPLRPDTPHLRGRATINGQSIRVMFDTGAQTSVLKLSAAQKLGFRPTAEGVQSAGLGWGVGRRRMESWIAPFDSFEVGGETIKNTRLRVADLELGDADMLIGADFFLSHRVYVSRKQSNLFFTYNGGPVFRLDRERPETQAADAAPAVPAAPAETAAAGDPSDAAGFARRGSAFMARRNFPRALADFDRAVQLEPTAATYYVERAMAQLGLRRPDRALPDLDQALKLKPDDVSARLARGRLYLDRRDLPHAEADFEAAVKAAGPQSALRLGVGALYSDAGQYERAIAQYDAWIAANPQHEALNQALNGRCWARGLMGKQLETALADCDAALRRGQKLAGILDSRGLVNLRLGRLDASIADYDAALKMQPKNGWSLYGRGLAKLGKGLKAEGDADIAAGLALDPSIQEQAKRAGLESPTTMARKP